jgi:hypothetical protein
MLQLEQAVLMKCLSTLTPEDAGLNGTATGTGRVTKKVALACMIFSCDGLIFYQNN